MKTTSKRAEYIRTHYALRPVGEIGWEAVAFRSDGRTPYASFVRETREEVCRLARCHWGHFNFNDEAQAFGEIFR